MNGPHPSYPLSLIKIVFAIDGEQHEATFRAPGPGDILDALLSFHVWDTYGVDAETDEAFEYLDDANFGGTVGGIGVSSYT